MTAAVGTCSSVDDFLAKKNLFDCPSYFSGSVDGFPNTATEGFAVFFRRLSNAKTPTPTRIIPNAMAAPSAAFVPVDIPFEEGGEPLLVAVVGPPKPTVVPVPVTEERASDDSPLVKEGEIFVAEDEMAPFAGNWELAGVVGEAIAAGRTAAELVML